MRSGKGNSVVSEKWMWRGIAALGLALIIFPGIDLSVSRMFYQPGFTDPSLAFAWRAVFLIDAIHWSMVSGSYLLAGALVAGFLWCAIRLRPLFGLGTMAWLFLAMAMAVGPGLLVNTVFKENWQRARPVQIEDFGGARRFSPALVVSNQCTHNCSFVCGEAAAGFFLHSFAYVARRRQRAIFYGGIAAGLLAGLIRIGQGAHFLSDVLYAGALILAASAGVHALIHGRGVTAAWWRTHILPRRPVLGVAG